MTTIRNIYVLGSHKLSSDYITKLKRAQNEGLLHFNNIYYIDEVLGGWAAKEHPEVKQIVNTYAGFLSSLPSLTPPYKGGKKNVPPLCKGRPGGVGSFDILIPDHTAPHVLFQLFLKLAEQENIKTQIKNFETDLNLPFQKTFDSGVCAISYATWVCPIDCDEPSFCPGKNDKRDWDFELSLADLKMKFENKTHTAHIFNCPQLAYGVVGISIQKIANEWERLMSNKTTHAIVATHTKCHGIIGEVELSY
ncbi:hypothetical protein K1X76_03930 [bacterium]|nr:hypothetical protein [bacterium]